MNSEKLLHVYYKKKTLQLCTYLVLCYGCNSDTKKEIAVNKNIKITVEKKLTQSSSDSLKLDINCKPVGNYTTIVNKIKTDKAYFKNLYQTNTAKAIDSASKYLYAKLINTIVPHWYGTPWDFNGHTNTPNDGEIACGYFVSTTLRHLDFNLNRYKMAQAAGLDEARLLQSKSDIKTYSNLSFKQLKHKINSVYSDGIYFVGLDNHVGYILIKDKELYFLHSSYCVDKVIIELAETSPCFNSNLYVFAEITTNKKLIKSWILNKRLSIS